MNTLQSQLIKAQLNVQKDGEQAQLGLQHDFTNLTSNLLYQYRCK